MATTAITLIFKTLLTVSSHYSLKNGLLARPPCWNTNSDCMWLCIHTFIVQ